MIYLLFFSLKIHFVQGAFDPLNGFPTFVTQKPTYSTIEEAGFYGLIQFSGPVYLSQRKYLENLGIRIEEYYKDYTYLVKFPGKNTYELLKQTRPQNIRWVGIYQPAFKIHPTVYTVQYKTPQLKNDPWRYLEINLFLDADIDYVASLIKEKFGAEIVKRADLRNITRICRLYIHVDPAYIEEIARIPEVKSILPYTEKFILNEANRWVHQTNVQVDTLIWQKGVHGEGQILGIMDSGVDQGHCFFDGTVGGQAKIVGYNAYGDNLDGCTDGHGTHVAGTAAGGDDNIGTQADYKGMAYKSRIYVQDVQSTSSQNCSFGSLDAVPNPLYNGFQDAYNNGARIHTNSWGGGSNSYDDNAADEDQFIWDNPDFLILFAAGNSSSAGQSNGANLGNQATAKNIITVGALAHAPNQEVKSWFSSEGPPPDNRWKPDLMASGGDDRFAAPNDYTHSADNDPNSNPSCNIQGSPFMGTSMATPVVAGSALLTRQWLQQNFGYTSPAAALIKAVLIAGAEPVTGTGDPDGGTIDYGWPSYDVGWGRINLRNSFGLKNASDTLLVQYVNGLYTGDADTYEVRVTNNIDPVRFVLVWTDYPAPANSNGNLQNDLNLQIIDPNNNTYWGNNIDRNAKESTPGGTADNVNNVEVVHISTANLVVNGVYQVIISGANVSQPGANGQPYALAITGDVEWAQAAGTYSSLFSLTEISDGIKIRVVFDGEKFINGILKKKYNNKEEIVYNGSLRGKKFFEYIDKEVEKGEKYTYTFYAEKANGNIKKYGPLTIEFGKNLKGFDILKISSSILKKNQEFMIVISNPEEGDVSVELIDNTGRVTRLLKRKMNSGIINIRTKLPVGLKSGVYFLRIKKGKEVVTKKLTLF